MDLAAAINGTPQVGILIHPLHRLPVVRMRTEYFAATQYSSVIRSFHYRVGFSSAQFSGLLFFCFSVVYLCVFSGHDNTPCCSSNFYNGRCLFHCPFFRGIAEIIPFKMMGLNVFFRWRAGLNCRLHRSGVKIPQLTPFRSGQHSTDVYQQFTDLAERTPH